LENEIKEKELDPVFVLMRTSNRPMFFEKCYESIKKQTYKNIILIVHSDDPTDKYVKGDIIIRSELQPSNGSGYYNLYNNKLLAAIPKKAKGWYHFIDDDDCYADNFVIERLVDNAKKDCVNVGKSQRRDGVIYPKRWKNQKSFQTECFFLHTEHKDKAQWWERRGGDHAYSKQLTAIMPINWIDMLICIAQAGKGYGKRMDLNEQERFSNQTQKTYRCGARGSKKDFCQIRYLEDVKGRDCISGVRGKIRFMHKDYASILEKEKRIEILKVIE